MLTLAEMGGLGLGLGLKSTFGGLGLGLGLEGAGLGLGLGLEVSGLDPSGNFSSFSLKKTSYNIFHPFVFLRDLALAVHVNCSCIFSPGHNAQGKNAV